MRCAIISLPCFNSTAIALSLLQSPSFEYYIHEPSRHIGGIKEFLNKISGISETIRLSNNIYKFMAENILNADPSDQRELREILESSDQILILVRLPTLYAQSIAEKTAGFLDFNDTDIEQYKTLEMAFMHCKSIFPGKVRIVDTSLIKSNPEKFLPELCDLMAIQYDQNMIDKWEVRLNGPDRNVFLGYEDGDPWAKDTFTKTKLEKITRIPKNYNTFNPGLSRLLKNIANKIYQRLIDSPESFGGLSSGTISTLLGRAYSDALGIGIQELGQHPSL